MSTPEDQIDTSAPPQGALSSLQAPSVSPEGRAWGENYLKAHPEGVDTKGEAALLQDFAANAEEARQALRQARERLSQQRLNPAILGYNFAAAMLSPSRGGVSDQWSKAASTLSDYAQRQQEFEQQRGTQDVALAEQLQGVDKQALNARLALQELKERTQGSMLDAAMKATAQPVKPPGKWEMKGIDTDKGKQNVFFNPETRDVVPYDQPHIPGAGQIDDTTKDYLYQYWNNNHALPAAYGRNAALANYVLTDIAHRAATEGKTDEAILANSQLNKAHQQTEKDFAPGGKYGTALVSTNRVVAHLGDYMDLFNALDNGNVQAINYAKNKVKTWFGSEPPTDIQAVAPILGDELTKSIVPGGGGVTERQEFGHNFSAAKSPGQAASNIQKYLQFLKDQVEGTQYAYENSLNRQDFRTKFLTPRTREAFGYEHPAEALTKEQREALIAAIKAKQQAAPAGAP
jgi:hypothetical protein